MTEISDKSIEEHDSLRRVVALMLDEDRAYEERGRIHGGYLRDALERGDLHGVWDTSIDLRAFEEARGLVERLLRRLQEETPPDEVPTGPGREEEDGAGLARSNSLAL